MSEDGWYYIWDLIKESADRPERKIKRIRRFSKTCPRCGPE